MRMVALLQKGRTHASAVGFGNGARAIVSRAIKKATSPQPLRDSPKKNQPVILAAENVVRLRVVFQLQAFVCRGPGKHIRELAGVVVFNPTGVHEQKLDAA